MPFLRVLVQKGKLKVYLEFELAYYDVTDQLVSHYAQRINVLMIILYLNMSYEMGNNQVFTLVLDKWLSDVVWGGLTGLQLKLTTEYEICLKQRFWKWSI